MPNHQEQKPTPSLRELIRTCAKAYEGGDLTAWDHLIDTSGHLIAPGEAGDQLVDFLINEIGDVYDAGPTSTTTLEQRIDTVTNALDRAIREIIDVQNAISILAR